MTATFSAFEHLVDYWQASLWRDKLNNLPLFKEELPIALYSVSAAEVVCGSVATPLPPEEIWWVAPWVFISASQQLWIPIWLPAVIKAQNLTLAPPHYLPWIPASQFDSLTSQGIFSEPLHHFDEWLHYEYLTAEEEHTFQSWESLFQASKNLLATLSNDTWQQQLLQRGYQLSTIAYLYPHKELIQPFNQSALFKQFSTFPPNTPQCVLSSQELQQHAALLCGPARNENPLDAEVWYGLLHAMLLPSHQLMAIKSPVGRMAKEAVEALINSLIIQSSLTVQELPNIYVLSIDTWLTDFLYEFESLEINKECLQQEYNLFKDALSLAHQYYRVDQQVLIALSQQIEKLQKQDEKHERKFDKLVAAQNKLQEAVKQRPWLLKMAEALFSNLKSKQEWLRAESSLIEKIRSIKVERAKAHRQLINLIEELNTLKSVEKTWQDWLAQHCSCEVTQLANESEACTFLHHHFAKKLLPLALSYLSSTNTPLNKIHETESFKFPLHNLYKLTLIENVLSFQKITHLSSSIDYLIITEANQLLPQQIAPLLGYADKALFIGDQQDLPPIGALSANRQEYELSKCQIDEELMEDFHYHGALPATGNAFTLALAHNYWQSFTEFDTWSSTLHFPSLSSPKANMLSINGQSEKIEAHYVNKSEACAVIELLLTGPLKEQAAHTLIVTPFVLQKGLLEKYLAEAGLYCKVCTFYELPAATFPFVVFSPVYSCEDRRPFLFDQGEHFLNSLKRRAETTLWIVGNKGIFSANTHCPSGKLAKTLLEESRLITEG